MTPREWGLLALLSLLWGGSYFFVGVAVGEIPPLTLVTLRVGLAAALLWLSAPFLGVALPRGAKTIGALAVMGFGNNALPFALITWGQTHLASGLASILVAATPLFTVLAAHVLTAEEKLSGLKLFGTLAGLMGVGWLIGPAMLFGDAANNVWAELALLAAALCYALSAIYARRMPSLGLKPIDVATGQATAATVFLAPLALAIDRPWTLPMPSAAVDRGGAGDRGLLHRARVHRLLPHSGRRGRDQCAAGDPSDPGDGGDLRRSVPARAVDGASILRLRPHRNRSRLYRWPPAPRAIRLAR